MTPQTFKGRGEYIATPVFVSMLCMRSLQFSVFAVIASLVAGACWFYSERYFGKRLQIAYSFWAMQKDSSITDKLRRSGRFSKKRHIHRLNILLMVAMAFVSLAASTTKSSMISEVSMILGGALFAFLLFDFYHQYLAKETRSDGV